MEVFKYDKSVSKLAEQFNSSNVRLTRIVKEPEKVSVAFLYVKENGLIELHKNASPELSLVIDGEGWITNGERKVNIHQGEGVYWDHGEQRGAGTKNGMTVLIITGEKVYPKHLINSR
ncbi:hypothetical protein C8P63_110109 [Melghirimyces profundicolus]|uniref:Cupin domain n=1 Tax=Melghirimyces profundicolus TaxID=1242148 RepID=A0A2T6BV67_9BACL|nr:hypothetical protein [Melghirimyces profundicolus]PTX59964.1 hypothetical protein C8P63_110109 [Melghirimyces profundicolus]